MPEKINQTCLHFKKIKTQRKNNKLQCQMFYKKFEIEAKKKNIEKLNKNKNKYFLHFYHTLK